MCQSQATPCLLMWSRRTSGAADSSQECSCAGERPLDDSKRLCAHLLEKAVDELDDGGETILGIFDLRGFGTQNADFGFVRFLVSLQRSPITPVAVNNT